MAIIKRTKNNAIEINSDMIKIVIASEYRYRKRYKYVCTEFAESPKNIMDVCAYNEKYLTEIEVKTSRSDLYADGKKTIYKRLKHQDYYSLNNKSKYVHVPNYFYFAITQEMYEDKLSYKFITELNPSYGIYVVYDWSEATLIKQAKILHKDEVILGIKDKIIYRITVENICLRKKLYELKLEIKNNTKKKTS